MDLDQAELDWIAAKAEDHGNVRGHCLERDCDRVAAQGDNQSRLGCHDVGGHFRNIAIAAVSPANVNGHVLAVDIACGFKAFAKSFEQMRVGLS